MTNFKRGLTQQKFIDALNQMYNDHSSFWYKMVNDKDFFIAIRKDYLNIYYNGQSICKLSYNNFIRGDTHKKYLGIQGSGYCYSSDGIINDKTSIIKSLSQIDEIKINVNKYIGKEKRSSYSVILDKLKSIIDVEITFIKAKIDNPVKISDYLKSSIDYVALEKEPADGMKLIFYEAKHITNSEIRSRTTPKVIDQIKGYEEALREHANEIISSYILVLQNLIDLNILTPEIMRNQSGFGNLTIDFKPRLIIFGLNSGYQGDPHIQILRNSIGGRLILVN